MISNSAPKSAFLRLETGDGFSLPETLMAIVTAITKYENRHEMRFSEETQYIGMGFIAINTLKFEYPGSTEEDDT